MKHAPCLVLGLVLVVGGSARAEDDAKKIVERAIKAHGGEDNLVKFKASTITFKGDFHGMGAAIPMSGQISTEGPDKVKVDVEVEAGGQKVRVVNVFDGEHVWAKIGDNLTELDKDSVAEAREKAHGGWVANLIPLRDKGYTLAPLGETKVNDKPAVGVKVKHKDHRDVDLYFDKETGLLVKSEMKVKEEGSGQEVSEETTYAAYKDVEGTKQSTKITVKHDGKLYLEGEMSDHHLFEKLDAGTFAKP